MLLNVLSINIGHYDSLHGSYQVRVKMDERIVTRSKRWCGNLLLQNNSGDPRPDLVIGEGVHINLDRSGTPNTHLQLSGKEYYPDFIRPTTLVLSDTANLLMQAGSRLLITDSSEMDVGADCRLELAEGSLLSLSGRSHLYVSASASIILNERAKILLEDEGLSIYRHNGQLVLQTGAGKRKLDGDLVQALSRFTTGSLKIYK
jgi:hypothetical protein